MMEPFPFNSDNYNECLVSLYKEIFKNIEKGLILVFRTFALLFAKAIIKLGEGVKYVFNIVKG